MSSILSNKKLLIGGGVGVAVAAVLLSPVYAESTFKSQFVEPMESAGFTVSHEPVTLWNSNFPNSGTEELTLARGTTKLALKGVTLGANSLSFKSSQFGEPELPDAVISGEGRVHHRKGSVLEVSVEDVVVNDRISGQTPSLQSVKTFDAAFSVKKDGEAVYGKASIESPGVGVLGLSGSVQGADVWGSQSSSELFSQLEKSKLVTARVSIDNKGGFEKITEEFAVEQGLPPEQASEYLKVGFASAAIPSPYKETIMQFVDSPGTLSGQISPQDKSGALLKVSQIKRSFEDVAKGYVHPLVVLKAMNFQLTAMPKSG